MPQSCDAFSRKTLLIGGILWATFTSSAWALQPLITDDTGTQGQGRYQLEAAWNENRTHNTPHQDVQQSLPLTATYGLSEHLDVFFSLIPTRLREGASGTNTAGLSNSVVGAKWRFFEQKGSGWSLGLKPQISLPISRSREVAQLGSGKASIDVLLVASHEAGWGAVHINLGAHHTRYLDTVAQPNTRHFYLSAAPVISLSETVKLGLDTGLQRQLLHEPTSTVQEKFILLGLIYSPHQSLDWALGVLRRSSNQNPQAITRSATLGLTWRF